MIMKESTKVKTKEAWTLPVSKAFYERLKIKVATIYWDLGYPVGWSSLMLECLEVYMREGWKPRGRQVEAYFQAIFFSLCPEIDEAMRRSALSRQRAAERRQRREAEKLREQEAEKLRQQETDESEERTNNYCKDTDNTPPAEIDGNNKIDRNNKISPVQNIPAEKSGLKHGLRSSSAHVKKAVAPGQWEQRRCRFVR